MRVRHDLHLRTLRTFLLLSVDWISLIALTSLVPSSSQNSMANTQLTSIPEEIFEKLPPNLDVLEMRGFPRLSGDMSTLPRSLRVIDLGSAKPPEGGLLGLPNSLQVFKLNACYPVNQALLQNLPPDLVELRLSWCRTLKNDTLEFLPQKLKVLSLFRFFSCLSFFSFLSSFTDWLSNRFWTSRNVPRMLTMRRYNGCLQPLKSWILWGWTP